MLARIRALIDRWQQIKTVEALTDRDLSDLGMTRAQILAFIRMPSDVPERVARMAARFAIPETDLTSDHALYLELLGTCATCTERSACAHLLLGSSTTTGDATLCPNAPHYIHRRAA